MMTTSRLYFEAHITVDAGETEDHWQDFLNVMPGVLRHSKFDEDNVDNYHGKWFMSARETDIERLKDLIYKAMCQLEMNGFNVIRWKVEDTLLDSKYGDTLEI